MENKDISQIALQKIQESGIKPISKNVFNFKRVLFWSLVGFSLVIGAVSFSIILLILFNNDWFLYSRYGFSFILKTLPYFWFVCLLLVAILGEFYYRKTYLGYRHRMLTIIGAYIILTMISGLIIHLVGLGNVIEESLSKKVPVYHSFMFDRNEFWSRPEEGLISGRIILVDDNVIKIVDFDNTIWTINTENAFVGGRVQIREGEFIRIIGDIDDNSVFTALQVRPWMGSKFNKNIEVVNMMR